MNIVYLAGKAVSVLSFMRFFVTYRWELGLFVAIPYITFWTIPWTFSFLYSIEAVREVSPVDGVDITVNLTRLVLLLVPYLLVRRLDRFLLVTLWQYMIVVEVGTLAIRIIMLGMSLGEDWGSAGFLPVKYATQLGGASLISYGALLWFARRLTRASLLHGFMLVALSNHYGDVLIDNSVLFDSMNQAQYYFRPSWYYFHTVVISVGSVLGVLLGALRAWLVGNFEWRGPGFRKKALIAWVATVMISGHSWLVQALLFGKDLEGPYTGFLPAALESLGVVVVLGVVVNLAGLAMLFGLVYLIRVRQPKTEIVESHA